MTNVNTLIEALPYIREFRGKTFVIRCASRLSDSDREALCRDLAMLRFVGVKTVVVHPYEQTGERDGVSDARQRVNHQLVHGIGEFGKATGLSGSDGAPHWLLSISPGGELVADPDLVLHVIDDYTPVVEAVAVGPGGDEQPADPDLAAAKLAIELEAYKLLLVIGDHRVTIDEGEERGEVSEMRATPDVISRIRRDPPIDGALRAGLLAIEHDVRFAHIIPSDRPHALLLELFTNVGYGTKIRSGSDWSNTPTLHERGYFCWKDDPDDKDPLPGPV